MMRLLALSVLGLALPLASATADQIPGSRTKVANWEIGAYDSNGKFSHCAMSVPYKSGITMLFSISGNYTWRLGWTHPAWNFTQGQSIDITVFVDSYGPYSLKASAISKDVAVAELPPKAGIFDVMRKGYGMTVHAVGNVYKFSLNGTYAALTEILACVNRYSGAIAKAPPPQPMLPRMASSGSSAEAVTAEQRLEATKAIANILAQSDMTGFRILSTRDVAELKSDYFSRSDVVWMAEDVIGTLRIITKAPSVSARDIATAVVADDLKNCKGQSASGSTKDEKSSDVVRMFTACQAGKDSWDNRYTVVPRDDGTYYLFAMASIPTKGERGSSAAKADALLRNAVYEVLNK